MKYGDFIQFYFNGGKSFILTTTTKISIPSNAAHVLKEKIEELENEIEDCMKEINKLMDELERK